MLKLFQFIFSYVSFSIQFCFIILTLFISNISHIFLFDFNRHSVSIFSTSAQLLSSEVHLFIYDFKRSISQEALNCLYFDIHKVQTCNMTKRSELPIEIISYYHLLLLLNCIILI